MDTPEKQISALDASLSEEDARWLGFEPYLDDAQLKTAREAIENATKDAEGRANAIRDLLNCLVVADD